MNSWFHNRQKHKSLDHDVTLYTPKVDPEKNWGNMNGYGSDGEWSFGPFAIRGRTLQEICNKNFRKIG
jgi:hypothetical protein